MFEGIMNFFVIAVENMPKFRGAIGNTLLLSILSIIFGVVIGIIVNLMTMTKIKPLVWIAKFYIAVIRGTPLLLQLFFVFYGLPQIGIYFSSFASAVLGLAFHNGAYISEIFRGAILAVPHGQNEASRAIGMTKLQAFRHVIFPQAFKHAVPALGNQFLVSVLDSSLASVITITETMMKARQLAAATYSIFPIYFDAALFYLLMTYVLSFFLKKLENRLKVNER
ncbi:MAG TPA: amino acid ABC transporter permease [Lachnospiraceae bacterium]|nr:amino acid ABC transporter permease [Lachnospiraceae bacterium]